MKAKVGEQPLVSIVIPNWNGRDILRECLRSIEHLTYPNYEVIVVDNGSSDGSPSMVKREFPNIKIVVNERNLGFTGGCNVGIRLAKGEMIALFNNDAIADSSWLTELVRSILNSTDIGVVGGPILCVGSSLSESDIVSCAGGRIDSITGIGWCLEQGKQVDEIGNVDDIDYIPFCAALMRKEAIERVGLLDEGYFVGWDDVDWCLHAARAGYKSLFSPLGIVWHNSSYSRKKIPVKSYYLTARAFFRCCLKHFPPKNILSTLFFQLLVVPVLEVCLLKRSALCVIQRFKAFIWNISRLKEILSERRTISRLGKATVKNRFQECLAIALSARSSERLPLR